MTSRSLLFCTLFFLIPGIFNKIAAQRFQGIEQAEDSLGVVLDLINGSRDDSSKTAFNQLFINELYTALKLPSSDHYPFESLKTMVKISSPDDKFRIFQWNLPSRDGRQHFFGFLKMLNREPPVIYPLIDISDSLTFPDTVVLRNLRWFGALYYKIMQGETVSGRKVYTLLGWAGKNDLVTQKVIEILCFDANDRPEFGQKLFPDFQGGDRTRVIYRFSATTTMALKYETQSIETNKRWNSRKNVFEYSLKETQMIVADKLVPLDPQLEGQYQFYVPAGDISDGFIFEKNSWKYITGVNTRNRK